MLAFEQPNQERVLVRVVGAFPARRKHARSAAQGGHAQARVFGQRQQGARATVGFGFENSILGEGRAGLVDVEVNADIWQCQEPQW